MKKLILILMIAMLSGFAYSQQAVAPAPSHVRFRIHTERCMIRHERNGIRHDFRRFHRYMHFRHMRHRHRHLRHGIDRPGR
jgi:hypothetical protein